MSPKLGLMATTGGGGPLLAVNVGPRIPSLQITLSVGASTRLLNGSGSAASAANIAWSSISPGGHEQCTFDVTEAERAANPSVYRYGAFVVVKIAPGEPDAGIVIWTGFMQTPTPTLGAYVSTITALGFQQLLRDSQDPLLWMSHHIKDWTTTDDQPWGSHFKNAASMQARVGGGHIAFSIRKRQPVVRLDASRVGFYYDDTVNVTRVRGTVRKWHPVPSASAGADPNYSVTIHRYDGPKQPGSDVQVYSMSTQIMSPTDSLAFDSGVLGTPKPAVTIEFTRVGKGRHKTAVAWKVWLQDVTVNGDAYQGGRTPDDTYIASNAVKDIAALAGLSATGVVATTQNCLPLWHQSGPWSDTLDHLATVSGGVNGYRWAVWDLVGGLPDVTFAPWNSGNTIWTTNGFTSAATSICQLDTLPGDLYSKVIVTFRRPHSKRLHRVTAPITPNPFAGLDAPLAARRRAKRYHLDEPQRDSVLASQVAINLAAFYSTEQYDGTIQATYLNNGGSDRWAGEARAGDRIVVSDFPGGAKTFRIVSMEGSNEGPCTLHIGSVPGRFHQMVKHLEHQARDHGNRNSHH